MCIFAPGLVVPTPTLPVVPGIRIIFPFDLELASILICSVFELPNKLIVLLLSKYVADRVPNC